MKPEDCWMTFSEALKQYLSSRDALNNSRMEDDKVIARESMDEAAEHMDALTRRN